MLVRQQPILALGVLLTPHDNLSSQHIQMKNDVVPFSPMQVALG